MSTSIDTFVSVLKRSSLLSAEKVQAVIEECREQGDDYQPRQLADRLVGRGDLTEWQVDKLLKGRHKGFFLGKYKLLKMIGKGG